METGRDLSGGGCGGGTENSGGNILRSYRSFPDGNSPGNGSTTYEGSSTVVLFEARNPSFNTPDQKPPNMVWKSEFISNDENKEGVNQFPRRKLDSGVRNFVKEINIALNHFPVKITFPKTIYHYKITTELAQEGKHSGPRQVISQNFRRRILQYLIPVLQEKFSEFGIISDFSNLLYSTKRLQDADEPMDYSVAGDFIGENATSQFKVQISRLSRITDTRNLALDVNNMRGVEISEDLRNLQQIYGALIQCINLNAYTPVNKTHLIDYTAKPHPLGGGLYSFPGYNIGLSLTNGWKKFINIEPANLATYLAGPVTSLIRDVLSDGKKIYEDLERNVTKWTTKDFTKLNNMLRSCKISYESQPGKKFSRVVERVSPRSVSQTKFEYNGKMISIFDYFTTINKINLKYPDGPAIQCRGGSSPTIPAEICTLTRGQSYNRGLNEAQRTKIAEKSRLEPQDLQPAINLAVENLKLGKNTLLKAYGVDLDKSGAMHEVKARVLAAPELCYGKQVNADGTSDANKRAYITPDNGVWNIWDKDFEFFTQSSIHRWGILDLAGVNETNAKSFAKQLSVKANTRGMKISESIILYKQLVELKDASEHRSHNVQALTTTLKEFQEIFQKDTDETEKAFVLVILSKKGSHIYNHVKQAAELDVGILTQCILAPTMFHSKLQDSILGNILLKLNSKMTNVNHVVQAPPNFRNIFSMLNYPTMIIGVDVTHPQPGSSTVTNKDGKEIWPPSFAAVTASIDRTGMPYMMHIQAQRKADRGAAEVVRGMEEIMVTFLERYYKQTQQVPMKIIYYRDGVGDGQFQEVLRTEMSAMRRGCTTFLKNCKPSITFITVQKRHKTRFFMRSGNTYVNAPPGTVVDEDIVHPTENEFYLLSHAGQLGTSRPTRYHVLWDDSDFSMNELQTMTYFLCFMYARCNRSVKMPASTYYAHWAARRAVVLSEGWIDGLQGNIPEVNARLRRRESQNGFAVNYPMHFV